MLDKIFASNAEAEGSKLKTGQDSAGNRASGWEAFGSQVASPGE